MSAYTVAKTRITDLKALQKALALCGFKQTELHNEPQSLYGYQGDKRKDKANLIIRRKYVGGCSNDIGFTKQADGSVTATISEYDKGRYNDKWLKEVNQRYAQVKVMEELEMNGYFIDSIKEVDGTIQIQAESQFA
jgi:hypothetical protein